MFLVVGIPHMEARTPIVYHITVFASHHLAILVVHAPFLSPYHRILPLEYLDSIGCRHKHNVSPPGPLALLRHERAEEAELLRDTVVKIMLFELLHRKSGIPECLR
jgi:hypothetical protein